MAGVTLEMADPADTGTDPAGDPPRRRGVIGGVIGRVAPAVMRQIDMDEVVELLDVNAIADQLDLDALMARMDMAQLTAGATQDVALSGLDLMRRQSVRADRTVDGLVDRLLRRRPGARPEAPSVLDATPPTARLDDAGVPKPRRREVSGHYAGPVTRILALMGDVAAALAGYGFFGAITLYLLSTLTGLDLTIGSGGWPNRVLLVSWMLVWFWVPVALFGRTLVMALVGLAVVRRDGGIANGRRAFVRALVTPVSLVILALGLIGMFIGRERRTLHDVAAGTVVVYDWGARQAEQPVSIREQLSARARRRRTRAAPVGGRADADDPSK